MPITYSSRTTSSRADQNVYRICRSRIKPFITFGRIPIANGLLTRDEIADEYYFDLEPAVCRLDEGFQIDVDKVKQFFEPLKGQSQYGRREGLGTLPAAQSLLQRVPSHGQMYRQHRRAGG